MKKFNQSILNKVILISAIIFTLSVISIILIEPISSYIYKKIINDLFIPQLSIISLSIWVISLLAKICLNTPNTDATTELTKAEQYLIQTSLITFSALGSFIAQTIKSFCGYSGKIHCTLIHDIVTIVIIMSFIFSLWLSHMFIKYILQKNTKRALQILFIYLLIITISIGGAIISLLYF